MIIKYLRCLTSFPKIKTKPMNTFKIYSCFTVGAHDNYTLILQESVDSLGAFLNYVELSAITISETRSNRFHSFLLEPIKIEVKTYLYFVMQNCINVYYCTSNTNIFPSKNTWIGFEFLRAKYILPSCDFHKNHITLSWF